jgi:hypothetical protein
LQRYVDAVGGKAALDIRSRTAAARESNTFGRVTEHYVYKFKWKAPDKVTATSTPYFMNVLPLSYPNGIFIFDGDNWSNSDRRRSRNEEREPLWQRALKHKYPYNEDPHFLMLRVIADPLMLTRASDLYSGLEVDAGPTEDHGLCVVQASGIDQWRYKRHDLLYFDAVSGLLRTWRIQAGVPPQKTYIHFQFNDYRTVGAVKFPFRVYFSFYDATFRFTEVEHNKPLADSEFVEKPAKP